MRILAGKSVFQMALSLFSGSVLTAEEEDFLAVYLMTAPLRGRRKMILFFQTCHRMAPSGFLLQQTLQRQSPLEACQTTVMPYSHHRKNHTFFTPLHLLCSHHQTRVGFLFTPCSHHRYFHSFSAPGVQNFTPSF